MEEKEKLIINESIVGTAKSIFGAIPFVGSALNELVFDIRGRIKQERFNQLLEELKTRTESLEESSINIDLIKSENFGDTFELIVKHVISRKMNENLKLLSDIAVSSLIDFEILDNEFKDQFITIIANLNSPEIYILTLLIPHTKANQIKKNNNEEEADICLKYHDNKVLCLSSESNRKKFNYDDLTLFKAIPDCPLNASQFLSAFDSLISKGCVFDDSTNRWGGRPRSFIKTTELGTNLINFIDKAEISISKNKK